MAEAARRATPQGRPARRWFVLAPLATIAIVVAAGFWPGFTDRRLALLTDVLSIAAAGAFLYGAWQSIETRTKLARLETIVGSWQPARSAPSAPAADERPEPGRGPDLAQLGKAMLSEELQGKLINHIHHEWLAYIIGTAILLAVLALSILGNALANAA